MATMKIFTLLIIIFLICDTFTIVSGQTEGQIFMQECDEEFPLSEDEKANLKRMEDTASTNAKCFLACFLKKGNLMNEYGDINIELGSEFITSKLENDEEKSKAVLEIYEDCATQRTAEDHCEIAAEFLRCCNKKIKEANIHLSVT